MIMHAAYRDRHGTLWRGKTAHVLAGVLPKLAACGFECGTLSALRDAAERSPPPRPSQRLVARLRRFLRGGDSGGYPWARLPAESSSLRCGATGRNCCEAASGVLPDLTLI